ncbi:MAG: DNA polymerase II, partial [Nanoarchaeota archaeon]
MEGFESEDTTFKDFDGKDVTKIILDSPKEVPEIRKNFEEEGIRCYEADVRFAYRFLIDNGLLGTIEIDGDYDSTGEIDRVYREPEIRPAAFTPKLNVLAIDIETNARTSQIYSISFYSEKHKGVLIHSDKELNNATCCASEEDLLNRFIDKIRELDPDVITGWNVIDFDLETIKKRLKKYNIPFCLGRDNSICKIKNEKGYFKSSTVDMPGRVVLDGIALLKSSFIKMGSYKLDDVAEHYLGEKKLVGFKDKKKEIIEMFKNNPQKLADYNLKDSELVYRILEKSDTLNLTMQRSLLTGMPLDRVGASIASLDQLYLREARKRGIVCPSGSYNVKEERIKGGYVKESEPGIYDYILVLDFKSLYPSIIRTFNIDPASFVQNCKGNVVKAPNGACFRNEDGILPTIIQRLWEARDKARKEKNELARYAIKILMNSMFGVMASPACRFFSLDVANAITHFGQHLIKLTAEKIEEKGYHVIYEDTDSALTLSKAKSLDEANEIGEKLQKEINAFYQDHIQKEYGRKSHLELEYEKCFIRFIMPKLRGQYIGAKKRYAGL